MKPLGRQLANVQTYAGATILGDGQIALILDPVVLAREAHIDQREALSASEGATAGTVEIGSNEQMLIVRLTSEVRAAIPLNQVKRLEEFPAKQIERVGPNAVIQYRGSILPLVDVAQQLGLAAAPWSDGQVVVVAAGDLLVGLQVQEILDVSSGMTAVKPVHGKPGIRSYGVVQGRVIALLDASYLVTRGFDLSETEFSEEHHIV